MQPSDKKPERLSGELKDLPLTEYVDANEQRDAVKGGATHEIVSPRDVASGQATGKRSHKPV